MEEVGSSNLPEPIPAADIFQDNYTTAVWWFPNEPQLLPHSFEPVTAHL
jgi:hypothetical protein